VSWGELGDVHTHAALEDAQLRALGQAAALPVTSLPVVMVVVSRIGFGGGTVDLVVVAVHQRDPFALVTRNITVTPLVDFIHVLEYLPWNVILGNCYHSVLRLARPERHTRCHALALIRPAKAVRLSLGRPTESKTPGWGKFWPVAKSRSAQVRSSQNPIKAGWDGLARETAMAAPSLAYRCVLLVVVLVEVEGVLRSKNKIIFPNIGGVGGSKNGQ